MLKCKSCGFDQFTVSEQTFKNGTKHLRASCAQCGAYLCYVPQADDSKKDPGEFKMHFGKHKGKTLKELPESYIHWLAGECQEKKVGQYAKAYLNRDS